jgi:predicted amidohydrolase
MDVRESSTTYRVAAIQYGPALGEKAKNTSDLLTLVENACAHGARLIVLPEMATTGYCWTSREEVAPYVETIPGPTTIRFQQLAAQYNCYIAVSLPEVDPASQAYYNSMALVGPDGLVGTYRKLHSSIAEPRWARDGDLGVPVWETPLGRLSALISTDARYCEVARLAALRGADVVLFPTNWAHDKSPCSWWMARAFENGLYIIAANRYDCERELQFSGGSCVLNPDGSIQSYLDNERGIVYGEVDLRCSRDKRWGSTYEVVGNRLTDRRPTEYLPLVNNTYQWEPLRYHSLYSLGELPAGQLSCTGIVQIDVRDLPTGTPLEQAQWIRSMLPGLVQDNAPARPDVVVLPELVLPGPAQAERDMPGAIIAHFLEGAITVPGPETDVLVALADELQMSIVIGVAERANEQYYNTVVLVDPEGVYGTYRKLHLTQQDCLWATPGDLGLPTFDTPTGRIGLATGYDVLFPETLRVLAGKGTDLVCAPALLNFPTAIGLAPTTIPHPQEVGPDEYDPLHYIIWRVRAAEHHVYLALANWCGQRAGVSANGLSGIFAPDGTTYPWSEVVEDEGETGLMMMTIDTREQRNGQRTTSALKYSLGEISGSLTGELAYNVLDSIPGNVVRSKPLLRKRQPFWYLDLVKNAL